MNVLYACDDRYAPLCGISMTSLFENNKNLCDIVVYILVSNVSEENISRLTDTIEAYNRKVRFINASDIDNYLSNLDVPKFKDSYATYYRIFLQQFLPAEVETILYVDCDTVFTDSIEYFEDYVFERGICCAAVFEQRSGDTKYKMSVGLNAEDANFNAGIMLINLSEWRRQNCEERLISDIKDNKWINDCADQNVLNRVLRGKIAVLHPRYNFCVTALDIRLYFQRKNALKSADNSKVVYSNREISEARKRPSILHLCKTSLAGAAWEDKNAHPYRSVWDKYKRISGWCEFSMQPVAVTWKGYLSRRFVKLMPKRVFATLESLWQGF